MSALGFTDFEERAAMNLRTMKAHLPAELAAAVERYAQDQKRSISSVIAEALRSKVGLAPEASNETQRRQLNRVEARMDKVISDQLILKESMLLFIRIWLEHNPPVDEEIEEAAAASAEARFERFLDFVAQGLNPGRSVANGAFPAEQESAPRLASELEAEGAP